MPKNKVLYLPMAGYGQRFVDAGYALPKQFLRLNNSVCLLESLRSLDLSYFDVIVVGCREEFDRSFNIQAFLESSIPDVSEIRIIRFGKDTLGSLDTCYQMVDACLDLGDHEVNIFTLDVSFQLKEPLQPLNFDCEIAVVKTNNPGFSYVALDADSGCILRTAEKRIISEYGAVGLYRFKSSTSFHELSASALKQKPNYKSEYYICPLVNSYISRNLTCNVSYATSIIMFGTPQEYEFAKSLRQLHGTRIAVASDHSGFDAKQKFLKFAKEFGFQTDDYGCYSSVACDYDDFVFPSCMSVALHKNDFAVSFCRSGQGVNISAASVPGIRSCLIYDISKLAVILQHNAPNHFAIPSEIFSEDFTVNFFNAIRAVEFEGGRHQDRLLKVARRHNKAFNETR